MNKLDLIRENSYLKLGIISLIENIPNNREYRDLKQYLTDLVMFKQNEKEAVVNVDKLREIIERGNNEKENR